MRTIACSLFAALFVLGCSDGAVDSPTSSPPSDLLAAPPAGQGVQYRMEATLEPGQETEKCLLLKAPPEGLAFNRSEIRYTPGSHHVLLYETPYAEMPTQDEHGVALDPTLVHDCPSGGPDRWSIVRVVTGSQNQDGANAVDNLPEGVAMKVKPGAVLLMNTHYLNATTSTQATDARINVWTVPPESVKTEAGLVFFYNPFIRVDAHSKATARMTCPVPNDVTLLNVQSHMHKRGVGYVANLADGDGKVLQELYTNTKWEGVPIKRFDGGLLLKAGQSLDYRCEYSNNETHDILQGLTTKDEMCMLLGPYYPRNDNFEICSDAASSGSATAGTWTGEGTATCDESYKCIVAASSGPKATRAHDLYGCVVDACPGAAKPFSAVTRCLMTNAHGLCDACTGSSCSTCVFDKCATEITACGAATCQ